MSKDSVQGVPLVIRVGEKVRLWDSSLGKPVVVAVVSVTSDHVVLRRPDGKLWCMTRNDYKSLRAIENYE